MGTCASDERLKTDIHDLTFGDPVQQILGLRPRSFAYTAASTTTYDGLIAQEVQQAAPELVSVNASTSYEEVRYGDVQWLMLEALQDVAHISGSFEDNLIAWLGSTSNGIHDIYASVAHLNEADVQQILQPLRQCQSMCALATSLRQCSWQLGAP